MKSQLFKSNKYTKWYFKIIEYAKHRDYTLLTYSEQHHIIPKSLGGTNDNSNIVRLSAKEHLIVHLLLVKMCVLPIHVGKMAFALMNFFRPNKNHQRLYSKNFEAMRKLSAKNQLGEKNGFYGKLHSTKTKQYLCSRHSINIIVYFDDGNIYKFTNRLELGVFLGKSKHLGAKLLKPQYFYLWKKYSITNIEILERKNYGNRVY